MKCSCPKCNAEIELVLPEVTEAGTPASCPLCKARVVVHRESFGARVFRKSGEISCATCGEMLGPQTYCASCGANFPDYLVISLGRKPISKVKTVKLKSSPFSKQISLRPSLPKLEPTAPRDAKPATRGVAAKKKGPAVSRPMVIALVALAIVAVAVGGVLTFLQHKKAAAYSKSFIDAAYCMQTAVDKAVKANSKVAADWKAKADAGQSAVPRLNADEEKDLRTIKAQVESLLQKTKEPPKKYEQASDKLNRLYTAYLKVHNLALQPPTSETALTEATGRVENDYRNVARDFKASLPPDLMNEMKQASRRHPNLKALVE